MFRSKVFVVWFTFALGLWSYLFATYCGLDFIAEHWHYPAIMILGAFVAGLTPEGGGAVAFPVLSIFFNIDRVLARDFSLMIQSVGMTSASIFVLTQKDCDRKVFRPLLLFIPLACFGFVIGMLTLQSIPVYMIQALFLSLIMAFALAYVYSDHRGTKDQLRFETTFDYAITGTVIILGGMCASLFGTGTDILLYSVLVTRFRLVERTATRMSIMIMAGTSIFGFSYRHFIDQSLTPDQYRVWICAYPVVLFMAPFGAYILSKINIEWMLKGIVILNIAQLLYFNINKPSWEKFAASLLFSCLLTFVFQRTFSKLSGKRDSVATTS